MAQLEDGSVFDHIQLYYRHGEAKVQLTDDEREYLERIEYVKDLWLADNDEVMTRNKIMQEYDISQRHAYNLIADAKKIWALTVRFDYYYELCAQKRWIDLAFRAAKEGNDGKLYKAAFDSNFEWMKKMREYQMDNVASEPRTFIIVNHGDYTELGVSHETMADWRFQIQTKVLPKAKSKFAAKPESIPYVDVREH